MASVFLGINDRTFTFMFVAGRSEFQGTGFRNPMDMALAPDDVQAAGLYHLPAFRLHLCAQPGELLLVLRFVGIESARAKRHLRVSPQNNVFIAKKSLFGATRNPKIGTAIGFLQFASRLPGAFQNVGIAAQESYLQKFRACGALEAVLTLCWH